MINKARPVFTIDEWLGSIFDPYFVSGDPDYAKRIVLEVPPKKRLDALINVYRRKNEGNLDNLTQVIREMLERLDENQLRDFMKEVSNELLKGGVRGKYVERCRTGTNLVLLDPGVAKAFPTAAAVNETLRLVIQLSEIQHRQVSGAEHVGA